MPKTTPAPGSSKLGVLRFVGSGDQFVGGVPQRDLTIVGGEPATELEVTAAQADELELTRCYRRENDIAAAPAPITSSDVEAAAAGDEGTV